MTQAAQEHPAVQVRNSSHPADWKARKLKGPLVQQLLVPGQLQHATADPALSKLMRAFSPPLRVFLLLFHPGCWGS